MTNLVLVIFAQNIDMLATAMERQGGEAAGQGEEDDSLSDAATSSDPVMDS